eukprot:m.25623 g.25623  ORF g.25623 m.25623 type:complete len:510 (-) comp9199_c0_seq2:67-1596(-)
MSNSVKDMIAMLDAEKIKQQEEAREAARRSQEEKERLALEASMERKRQEEEERKRLEMEREAERKRWHVNEDEAAKEVEEMKKAMLSRLEKPKPKPKVVVKDIQTIVVDLGSNAVKVGFAGEDAPRAVVSSIAGYIADIGKMDLEKHAHINKDYYFGDEVWLYADVLEIKRVIEKGVIQDYTLFELFLKYVFTEELKISLEELRDYPILVTEPPLSPLANREKLCRVMFDTFDIAALYVANTSTLAIFGLGRVTGVVVDIGHEVSMCAAVYHGEVIPSTVKRLNIGGRDLDVYLSKLLKEKDIVVSPDKGFESLILRDMKERTCYVAYDFRAEMKKVTQTTIVRSAWAKGGNRVEVTYEVGGHGNDMLPGYEDRVIPDEIKLDYERFQCPEALFDPNHFIGTDFLICGVHRMVQESIKSIPIDLKREMYGSIVLSGGTTLLKGFADRLQKELRTITPNSVEIHIMDSQQRHLAVWRGGSTIASTKGFNFHWISREEYQEYGVELLNSTR